MNLTNVKSMILQQWQRITSLFAISVSLNVLFFKKKKNQNPIQVFVVLFDQCTDSCRGQGSKKRIIKKKKTSAAIRVPQVEFNRI